MKHRFLYLYRNGQYLEMPAIK